MRRRTPLAWSLLTHNRTRFVLSVTCVALAVLLMFVEMGFLNGVYDSQTLLLDLLDADLVMVNRDRESFYTAKPFRRDRLAQALATEGVRAVNPLHLGWAKWRGLSTGDEGTLCILAFEPDSPPFPVPGMERYLERLKELGTVVIDAESQPYQFGDMAGETRAEINGRRVEILGSVVVGPNFNADGHAFMSNRTYEYLLGRDQSVEALRDQVELGAIQLTAGADPEQVLERMRGRLPGDVLIQTKAQAVQTEMAYWRDDQQVGEVFGLGLAVGLVIGIAICYQILFADLSDHTAEFATLKAIGYGDRQLAMIVFQEALYLGLLAFVPGLLISQSIYGFLQAITGIRMDLTPARAAFVLLLTVVMCIVSSGIAYRKVATSDPADVF
jgi:putative ABC transport system permease protein